MTVLIHFLGFLTSFTLAATDLGELVFQDSFGKIIWARSLENRFISSKA